MVCPGMLVRARPSLHGLIGGNTYAWHLGNPGAYYRLWRFDDWLLGLCLAWQPDASGGSGWLLVVCAHGVGWIQAGWLEVVDVVS